MFGCCNHSMQEFRKNYETAPDLDKLNEIYTELDGIVSIEEREYDPPRPTKKWMMVLGDGESKEVCTCGCHCAEGCAILC